MDVCDSLEQVVVRFDTGGAHLATWRLAEIYGQASEPEDIVVDVASGHAYIREVLGHRVLHLTL